MDDNDLVSDNPVLIPPALAEILDAVTALKPSRDPGDHIDTVDRADVIDRIMRELTTDHMEVIKTIAALATLHQSATGHQTFSEWLATAEARRTSSGHEIATMMDGDADWPRHLRTYAEFRDYVSTNHTHSFHRFDLAWRHYQGKVIDQRGTAGTIRTDIQYATRIAWSGGYDEIHPRTVDGTTRFEAEARAGDYNDDLLRRDIRSGARSEDAEPGSEATASVVRRTVVYGPWYTA